MGFIQEKAPNWEATAAYKGELTDVKLSDFSGKYLVMLFYPNAFTFVCPTEILAFNDRIAEFREMGAEVVAISVDSPYAALAWQNIPRSQGGVGSLNIPMVSDGLHSISKDYGVYLSNMGVSLRGLIIIDGQGIVRQITMNDPPTGHLARTPSSPTPRRNWTISRKSTRMNCDPTVVYTSAKGSHNHFCEENHLLTRYVFVFVFLPPTLVSSLLGENTGIHN